MDKSDKIQYLNKLEKYAEHLRLVRYYSVQRIDLLIISISSAGIYTCFEMIKYIDQQPIFKKYPATGVPFEVAGFLFTLAIIANFVSQWTASTGSDYALESVKGEIYAEENELEAPKALLEKDRRAAIFNRVTSIVNLLSNLIMIVALLILTCSAMNLF